MTALPVCVVSDIAIALHTPPHRSISLGLVAQAVGAKKQSALTKTSRQLSLKNLRGKVKPLCKANDVEVVSAASSSE